jgi:hypothetical protein
MALADDLYRWALNAPQTGDLAPIHKVVKNDLAPGVNGAMRFRISREARDRFYEILDAFQANTGGVGMEVFLPADSVFFEWPEENKQVGALVFSGAEWKIFVFSSETKKLSIEGGVGIDTNTGRVTTAVRFSGEPYPRLGEAIRTRLFAFCMGLQVKGAYQERLHTPPAKLQAARIKRGRPPLSEYRDIFIDKHDSKDAPFTETPGSGAHRRLHRVAGHLRLPRKDSKKKEMSWVVPHWRGDASAGVIISTRVVK